MVCDRHLGLARQPFAAGFTDPEVVFTHEAAPGMHGAIVRAVKPATAGVS